MSRKRMVEVFTAGCPLCNEIVGLVKRISCSSCDVGVYDLRESGMDRAKQYGVNAVPSVVVDGKILDCCRKGAPNEADLRAAGIGAPI